MKLPATALRALQTTQSRCIPLPLPLSTITATLHDRCLQAVLIRMVESRLAVLAGRGAALAVWLSLAGRQQCWRTDPRCIQAAPYSTIMM